MVTPFRRACTYISPIKVGSDHFLPRKLIPNGSPLSHCPRGTVTTGALECQVGDGKVTKVFTGQDGISGLRNLVPTLSEMHAGRKANMRKAPLTRPTQGHPRPCRRHPPRCVPLAERSVLTCPAIDWSRVRCLGRFDILVWIASRYSTDSRPVVRCAARSCKIPLVEG